MSRLLTKREKIILHWTIGLIIFSALLHIVIVPVLKKNDALNKRKQITRLRLIKYTRLLAQKESLEEKFKSVSSILRLPEQQKNPAVSGLLELENLAKAANIRIIDIRPQTTKQTGTYKETVIDIKTEGDMLEHMKFIYDIEHSFSLFTIRKLKLNCKPNSRILEGFFSMSQLSMPQ